MNYICADCAYCIFQTKESNSRLSWCEFNGTKINQATPMNNISANDVKEHPELSKIFYKKCPNVLKRDDGLRILNNYINQNKTKNLSQEE